MVRVSQNDLSLTTEIVQHCSRSPETLEAFNDHAALVRQCSNPIFNCISNCIFNPISNPIPNPISNPIFNPISNPISLADFLPLSDPDPLLTSVRGCLSTSVCVNQHLCQPAATVPTSNCVLCR